jgi:prephenate dehydrogenase
LTPCKSASERAVEQVAGWVEILGATPYFVDADEHDGVMAAVSDLPYLLAIALVTSLGREASWRESATLGSAAFSYATYLAGGDPERQAGVLRTNRANAARRLQLYITELERLHTALLADEDGDGALVGLIERAHGLREDWLAGRAQGVTGDDSARLPSSGALLRGSFLGGLGKRRT